MSYFVTYKITRHAEGIEAKDVPEGEGAAHAVLIASIIYPKSGGMSVEITSGDGRTDKALDDLEYFKVWAMLAHDLANSATLSEPKRELCGLVHEVIKTAILTGRAEDAAAAARAASGAKPS